MLSDTATNIILSRKQQLYDACYSVLSSTDTAVIVISGDIAFSGKEKEYENALDLIGYIQSKLHDYLGYSPKVLMIPGNHDCNFKDASNMRERLLSTFEASSNIDLDTLKSVTNIQKNFFDFSELFTKYDQSSLCNTYEVKCNTKLVLFQLINTAWMSQKREQPGKLMIPQNTFKNFDTDKYDCVFTVMHHPYNWLNPDNCMNFINFIRQTTDVLLIGHEHRRDSYTINGENWSISEFRGKELQNSENDDSAFSIYQFDDSFQNVAVYNFNWENNLYKNAPVCNKMFTRNTLLSSSMLTPSKKYITDYIDDPGMIIIHKYVDNVRLSEIYCWPDLEQLEVQNAETIQSNKRFSKDIPPKLIRNPLTVIIGEALSGKTAMAKMLFREYSREDKCCVLMQGNELNTIVESNLKNRIYKIFTAEYSEANLEKYRQLSPQKRIIIIDDFNNIPYHDERKSKVLSILAQFASNVIIFTDNEIDIRLSCSKLGVTTNNNIAYYSICCFGNLKRYEFIKKWYCLRNEYANGNNEIETKITHSFDNINSLLGNSNGFIPATPIFLINLLQNIDAAVPASFSGSQYGFLYDSLINQSLSIIKYPNQGAVNIDVNIMSYLAFHMLQTKSKTFSQTDLLKISNIFSLQKKVAVNSGALINNMLTSRLVLKMGPNTFKFRYPYIFYYFSGRYIAYNLNESAVKKQIGYMSQRLYNEKYSNIVIFICHFADNIDIIENILLVAYSSLEKYDIFDFDKHTEIFEKSKEIIDNILTGSTVGTESDVETNRQNELKIKDEIGLQDGSVHELTTVSDEVDEKEKDLASLSAAMHTLDVLGQIIMNYPGDIDGDVKISIIDEIHKLGMRITEAMLSTIGLLEKDFVKYVVEYVKDKKQASNTREIIQISQTIFSWIVAEMTCVMIRKISKSLCNEALLVAVQETFALSSSISQNLILIDLQFNILKKPNINEALRLADEFDKKESTRFAKTVLRLIISDYLKYNKCGHSIRAKLCSHFNLSDKENLIDNSDNLNF